VLVLAFGDAEKGSVSVWVTELRESGTQRHQSFFEYETRLEATAALQIDKVTYALQVEEQLLCSECFALVVGCACPKLNISDVSTFEVFKSHDTRGILGIFSGTSKVFTRGDDCLEFNTESMVVHPTSSEISHCLAVVKDISQDAASHSPLNKKPREGDAQDFKDRVDVEAFLSPGEPKESSMMTPPQRNRKKAALSNMRRKVTSYMSSKELEAVQQSVDRGESHLEVLRGQHEALRQDLNLLKESRNNPR